jgi:hypothetical protein
MPTNGARIGYWGAGIFLTLCALGPVRGAAQGGPPAGSLPRTPDGRPDLTGVWLAKNDLKPGEPALRPAAAAAFEKRKLEKSDRPSAPCLPLGPLIGPRLYKFVQTPSVLVIMFKDVIGYRQVFLDGRPHPKDWRPTWMGHSVGRWEGDTPIVDTVGFNNKSWLGEYSHSEQLHVIERYTRRDLGHMDVQVVMEDPETFLKPWTVNMTWNFAPGEEMLEYVCENNRDVSHFVGK